MNNSNRGVKKEDIPRLIKNGWEEEYRQDFYGNVRILERSNSSGRFFSLKSKNKKKGK